MPTYIRVKDLPNSASQLGTDDYLYLSGATFGARKILKEDFLDSVADSFNAAPSTYKLATLDASNKVDASQWPASAFSYQGTWAASSNTPTLANGSGTAGYTYYASDAGSVNFGAGAISFTAGDAVVYNGSIWQKVPDVVNILDGKGTVDEGKTTLQVPNVGTAANEVPVNGMLGDLAFQSSAGVVVDDLTVDGELTAAVGKPMPVNGPSMRFDGASDVSFADNDAFSFTNGTDDTPFTVTGWVKMEDATRFCIAGKWTGSDEWLLYVTPSDYLQFTARDSGSDKTDITSNSTVTPYEGQWIHVAATYGGAGPNSDSPFSANMSSGNAALYINGKVVSSTAVDNASYGGMSNLGGAVRLGKYSTSNYTKGEIRDVKLFNKELSLAEVREVYSNGQLPESFTQSTGAIAYASDFSAGVDGAVASNGTVVGNIDSIGGQDDNLRYTVDTTLDSHRVTYATTTIDGKRYKVSAEFYVPSTNSHLDGISIRSGSSSSNQYATDNAITQNAWVELSGELVATSTSVRFYSKSGGASTWQDASGTDVFYVRNVRITQIGAVLDARAEQFDTSTGKLYDLSGNDFVGTQSGGVQSLGKNFPVYETGSWTPSVAFGGGSTGVAYSTQVGSYTRVGNTVHIQAAITLNSVGTDTGGATIGGLPFTSYSANYATASMWSSGMSGLTSNILGRVTNSGSEIDLYDSSATGSSYISNSNFTASSVLRFSATYQIS